MKRKAIVLFVMCTISLGLQSGKWPKGHEGIQEVQNALAGLSLEERQAKAASLRKLSRVELEKELVKFAFEYFERYPEKLQLSLPSATSHHQKKFEEYVAGLLQAFDSEHPFTLGGCPRKDGSPVVGMSDLVWFDWKARNGYRVQHEPIGETLYRTLKFVIEVKEGWCHWDHVRKPLPENLDCLLSWVRHLPCQR